MNDIRGLSARDNAHEDEKPVHIIRPAFYQTVAFRLDIFEVQRKHGCGRRALVCSALARWGVDASVYSLTNILTYPMTFRINVGLYSLVRIREGDFSTPKQGGMSSTEK